MCLQRARKLLEVKAVAAAAAGNIASVHADADENQSF